ncbi:MAG: PD40 domain-containing protein [Chloroflexi bacterium]|nr:PD40 domain-containing protein [Chloroflexota bacterium]
MKSCLVCGERIDDDTSECFNCGAVVPLSGPKRVSWLKDADKSQLSVSAKPPNNGGKSQSLSIRLMGLFLLSLIIIFCCRVNIMGGFVDWFVSILPTESFTATAVQQISTTTPEDQIQETHTPRPENTANNPVTLTATSFMPTPPQANMKPSGRIVFTCQMHAEGRNQICIINADGSAWAQLTDNDKDNWYPSTAPDGKSVIYSSNISGRYQIYEVGLAGEPPQQINYDFGGNLFAPEISPDGSKVVFTHDERGEQVVWIMNRDGSNPHRISPGDGWDPSWSPNGKLILFTSSASSDGSVQLFTMHADGTEVKQITFMNSLPGRSDYSPSGSSIVTYVGKYGARSVYLIPLNGDDPVMYSFFPTSASPSFSPDGKWVAFTGYVDYPEDFDRGCEIYIIKLDDPTKIIRLTNNTYCDWQPRWGP